MQVQQEDRGDDTHPALKISHASESPGGHANTQITEPRPEFPSFWFGGCGGGALRMFVSIKFPGAAAAAAAPVALRTAL